MSRHKKSGVVTITVIGHVLVFILFAVFSDFKGCTPKPKERIQFVHIAQDMPSSDRLPDPAPPDPAPSPPEPTPPAPTPPDPAPAPPEPEPPPKPAWKPVNVDDIKINTEKVVRKPTEPKPIPTPEKPVPIPDYKDRLNKTIPAPTRAGPTVTSPATSSRIQSELGTIEALIRQKAYQAWTVPVGMNPQLETDILIRLAKNGTITLVQLSKSSGVHAYDQSAMAAANAVRFVKPLPVGYDGASEDFIVVFKQK